MIIAFVVFRESVGRRIWIALGIITLASILLSWNPNAAFGLSVGAFGYYSPVFSGVSTTTPPGISPERIRSPSLRLRVFLQGV